MFKFTLAELAQVTGGELRAAQPETTVEGFFVDSREPIKQGVFVAIEGERTNGHNFLKEVLNSGAGLAIVRDSFEGSIPDALPTLTVPDTVAALGQIAHWTRVTKLKAQVIAVTGSSGKTTTKDFIAGILARCGTTHGAHGSFNTEVGLPLTLLSADESTEFLVLEMGMRGLGHIESLARIAVPDIGVVTNVGSAHLELLKTQENIARAKGELIRSLSAKSWAVLNADDAYVREMAHDTQAHVASFGESSAAQFQATQITVSPDALSTYTLKHENRAYTVSLQIPGEHQVHNSLAAIAAAHCAGIDVDRAVELIEQITKISKWRMEVTTSDSGITVINDSYNANPESMRAALKTLVSMSKGVRSVAVLGPMKELGDHSMEEHDALGRLAVRLDISLLLCIGDQMKITHLGASQEGSWGDEAHWVPDIESALVFLEEYLQPGDVILVKASRSVGLDRVAEALVSGDVKVMTRNNSEEPL